jgi:arylformamidase
LKRSGSDLLSHARSLQEYRDGSAGAQPSQEIRGDTIMCEHTGVTPSGWLGWSAVPKPEAGGGTGDWIDLTHRLTEELSRSPMFPQPRIRQIVKMPEGPANITEIQMVAHHGTHVDAPRHFLMDGPTFDEIPLERLYGPGVVWRIEKGPFGVIEPTDFEAASPKVKPGDILLLDTGWAQHVNTEHYESHPSLSAAAAQWLVDHGVKMLGVDFSTPDLTAHKRPPDFNWPVHHILLSRGILVAEHVTNMRSLANKRVEVLFLALPLAGSDGAPARALARPLLIQ